MQIALRNALTLMFAPHIGAGRFVVQPRQELERVQWDLHALEYYDLIVDHY